VDAHDWYEDVLGRVLEAAELEAAEGDPAAFAIADVLLEAGATLEKASFVWALRRFGITPMS
jgi:uncharacterized membrane protein YfbV (UPF0208 family)